jgi:hypothetical protein
VQKSEEDIEDILIRDHLRFDKMLHYTILPTTLITIILNFLDSVI